MLWEVLCRMNIYKYKYTYYYYYDYLLCIDFALLPLIPLKF